MSDLGDYNRRAWDRQVEAGSPWTRPVGGDRIAAARRGELEVVLTPTRPVPAPWLDGIAGADLLALASGGGQQGPLLAAAGARVTVLDASAAQLEQDRRVSEREGLELRLEQGDMADLSRFADGSFDFVFHPASNCFVPEVEPVWRECFRVLRRGGWLLAGFASPVLYLFDDRQYEDGPLEARFRIPFASRRDLPEEQRRRREETFEPHEFGHSLDAQIGGQLRAGFVLVDLYEDVDPQTRLSRLIAPYLATRARKPGPRR